MGYDILQVGDSGSGVCTSHKSPKSVVGTITTGIDGADKDGILLAKEGSVVNLTCGHTGTLIASESSMNVSGDILAKLGDSWGPGSGATTGTITSTLGGISGE